LNLQNGRYNRLQTIAVHQALQIVTDGGGRLGRQATACLDSEAMAPSINSVISSKRWTLTPVLLSETSPVNR